MQDGTVWSARRLRSGVAVGTVFKELEVLA